MISVLFEWIIELIFLNDCKLQSKHSCYYSECILVVFVSITFSELFLYSIELSHHELIVLVLKINEFLVLLHILVHIILSTLITIHLFIILKHNDLLVFEEWVIDFLTDWQYFIHLWLVINITWYITQHLTYIATIG